MSEELQEEALAVKIIANDLLDNLEQYTTQKAKLDYLTNVLFATAFMIHRQFGADLAIMQIDIAREHIADDHLKSHIKNNSA